MPTSHTAAALLAVKADFLPEIARRGLALRSVSLPPVQDSDLTTLAQISTARNSFSLSSTQIAEAITTGMAPYVTKSYVDERDNLNATKTQVDTGDAGRLKNASINVASGVAGLDSNGRVPVARVPGVSTQRWPKGFYAPTTYAASTSAAGTEVTVFTLPVADPGYAFKLLIAGQFDCRTATDGDSPVVRVRVGSASGPVVAIGVAQSNQYRFGVDTFNRVSPNLGAGWDQFYSGPGSGHAETNGSRAYWEKDGTSFERFGVFRKIADFATTVDDYQEVFYRVSDTIEAGGLFGKDPHNRIYGRMNAARTSYVTFDMTDSKCSLLYATGGTETALVSDVTGFAQNSGDEILAQFGYYAATNKRRFRLIRNGTVRIDHTDSGSVTSMGTDNRGWGFGMQAGQVSFRQALPASLDWIALSDPLSNWSADPENYSPAVLNPIDLSTQASLLGSQTLYVTLRANSTATVYSTTTQPKLHVMAIPA